MTTTLPLLILVLVAISLALDVLILASVANLISRLVIDANKREAVCAARADILERVVRVTQESAAESLMRIPHFDA